VSGRASAEAGVEGGRLVVRLRGSMRAWALRSRIEVALSDIRGVRVLGPGERPRRPWLRTGGTSVPGLIAAGRFWRPGGTEFWAVRYGRPPVVIDLSPAARYTRLVLDVDDPEALARALAGARPAPSRPA
jgi:hypothetical protein